MIVADAEHQWLTETRAVAAVRPAGARPATTGTATSGPSPRCGRPRRSRARCGAARRDRSAQPQPCRLAPALQLPDADLPVAARTTSGVWLGRRHDTPASCGITQLPTRRSCSHRGRTARARDAERAACGVRGRAAVRRARLRRHRRGLESAAAAHGRCEGACATLGRPRRQAHPRGVPAGVRGSAPRPARRAARHRRHGRPERRRPVRRDRSAAGRGRPRARRQPRLPLRLSTKRVRGAERVARRRYTLTFSTDDDVFRLERKRLVHKERRGRRSPRRDVRFITEVRPIASVPVRCIEVDTEDHLYLAGRVDDPDAQLHAGPRHRAVSGRSSTACRRSSSRWR